MNDLIVKAHDLMAGVGKSLTAESVWASRPLGHTQYQIEKFVFNDREHPHGAARYRQALRELWARWGAYWQVRDQYDDLEFDAQILESEVQRLSTPAVLPWQRKRRAAERGKAELRLKQIERKRGELLMDLEHRIMPETCDILKVLQENAPSLDDKESFTMEAEQRVWEHRARSEPRLRELMGMPALINGRK